MDNRYAAPQLLAMMATTWNIHGVGACKTNQKGFVSDKLPMNNDTEQGLYIQLVDKRLGMVKTQWIDSRILQTVSTIMKPGISTILRHIGLEIIEVQCPSDIVKYQTHTPVQLYRCWPC